MPVRYVGKTGFWKGKYLFEILANLKNFGVGRMVVRRSYLEDYPEPTYWIIKKARPEMTDPELKKGFVIAEQVFRGRKLPEPTQPVKSGHTPDWWLVPKDEEEAIKSNTLVYTAKEPPTSVDAPPLFAKLYNDKLLEEGEEVTERYSLKLDAVPFETPHDEAVKFMTTQPVIMRVFKD